LMPDEDPLEDGEEQLDLLEPLTAEEAAGEDDESGGGAPPAATP
jgi:hypothetical protein